VPDVLVGQEQTPESRLDAQDREIVGRGHHARQCFGLTLVRPLQVDAKEAGEPAEHGVVIAVVLEILQRGGREVEVADLHRLRVAGEHLHHARGILDRQRMQERY
jgi:hypothetical protein